MLNNYALSGCDEEMMARTFNTISLIVILCLSVNFLSRVYGQEKTTTDVRIVGHIYETATLEPTDERVNQLRLPAGFRIVRFAEIANPRMLAVGTDGTVYVTQREPGTVSMLKDTNGDGVVDVQKVVAEQKMMHGIAIHEGKM